MSCDMIGRIRKNNVSLKRAYSCVTYTAYCMEIFVVPSIVFSDLYNTVSGSVHSAPFLQSSAYREQTTQQNAANLYKHNLLYTLRLSMKFFVM